ncbi:MULTISPECIES: ABC transporter ATP-binding protein [Undibacterium]|uniref:ABC transporter ATP-binding protein n=1 Tax=Undibacterium parvum TaxID=401471 RepID=A0A3Q9BNK1_9BURK|nr:MULTISPECIES: ABC transporter ATP-binding protein [Undibacterium]AZP11007.1 ABC transporter ATP-binding protein [Undibacterium parvum]
MLELDLQKNLRSNSSSIEIAVSFTAESHDFVSLFGPSGAGKTTLLRMLAGLTQPDQGRLVLDGVTWFDSAKKINLTPQQRSIGLVFQDYALFPNMNVRDNVTYGAQKNQGAWIDHLLQLTGLNEFKNSLPSTLSGGQKQRVALARALARKPKLLLLDEPLSALDGSLRSQLQDELLQLHQECRLTSILVSHDIGEVFKLSQCVHQMEMGKIIKSGTPAQVFLQQRLSGKLNLRAQVLAIRREEVIYVLSLLIAQDIVEIIAGEDEIKGLKVGDQIAISSKAFSPLIFRL